MKKHDILLATTAILSCAFCESVLAACNIWPGGFTLDSSSGNCVKSECNGKCTFYYNETTHDLQIEKNPEVPEGEDVIIPQYATLHINLNNVNVGEGITGMESWAFAGYSKTCGTANSTLKLPSTYKATPGVTELWNTGFGTIDASAVKDTTIYFPIDHNQNIILSADSGVTIDYGYAYTPGATRDINIVCRGKKSDCEDMVSFRQYTPPGLITSSYYSGPDGNDNWEEWSDSGKAIYADSTKAKPLATYGFDGKQTASYNYSAGGLLLSANTYDSEGNINGSYTYDAGGNLVSAYQNGKAVYLRKRYTIPEADAATQGKGPFRLDITW